MLETGKVGGLSGGFTVWVAARSGTSGRSKCGGLLGGQTTVASGAGGWWLCVQGRIVAPVWEWLMWEAHVGDWKRWMQYVDA